MYNTGRIFLNISTTERQS